MRTMWDIYEVSILGYNEDGSVNIGEAGSSAGWIARVFPEDLHDEETTELDPYDPEPGCRSTSAR